MTWSFWCTTGFWSIRRSECGSDGVVVRSGCAHCIARPPALFFQLRRRGEKQFVTQAVRVRAPGIDREVEVFRDQVERREQCEINPILQAFAVLAAELCRERSQTDHLFHCPGV